MDIRQELQKVKLKIAELEAAVKKAEDSYTAATDREDRKIWGAVFQDRSKILVQLSIVRRTLVERLGVPGPQSHTKAKK